MVFWIAIGLFFIAMLFGDPSSGYEWRRTKRWRRATCIVLNVIAALIVVCAIYDEAQNASEHELIFWIAVVVTLPIILKYLPAISGVRAPDKGQKFSCTFEKQILLPKKLADSHDILSGHISLIKKDVILPFAPQPGMAIKDSSEIQVITTEGKSDEYLDIYFSSGKIETVVWDNSEKKFCCEVETCQVEEKDIQDRDNESLIGWIIISDLEYGWRLGHFSGVPNVETSIKLLMQQRKLRIEKEEKETGIASSDRHYFEERQKLLTSLRILTPGEFSLAPAPTAARNPA